MCCEKIGTISVKITWQKGAVMNMMKVINKSAKLSQTHTNHAIWVTTVSVERKRYSNENYKLWWVTEWGICGAVCQKKEWADPSFLLKKSIGYKL